MNVTTKCKIIPLNDLSGIMRKSQKCDGQMDERADGLVGPFLLLRGTLITIVITIVVIDIGVSVMFNLQCFTLYH